MLSEQSGSSLHAELAGRKTAKPSIRLDDASSLFAELSASDGLLLAVSGGPDSMALLLMAARWKVTLGAGAPPIHVATVDHGLRAESRAEAEMVAAVAADLDLPHAILTWTGPKQATRVQERARAARYALLAERARAVGASHVFTAHHADDQAETVLLRLGRGSGLAGLAGMRRTAPLASGIGLVRPFLGVAKADLVAICRDESCAFVDDPSNHDPAFARPRLRARRQELAEAGLDAAALLRLSRRAARANAAIEAEVDRVEILLLPEHDAGFYRINLAEAGMLQPEIVLRLLGRAVAHVAGDRPIRLERLETLAEAILRALEVSSTHRGTIAGTRVVLGRDRVLTVTGEGPRRRGIQAPE